MYARALAIGRSGIMPAARPTPAGPLASLSYELIRVFQLQQAQGNGVLKATEALAEQCMADYDENGWTHAAFTKRTDISALEK